MIQQSASRPHVTLAQYARARAARILPVALFSLILSTSIFLLLVRNGLLDANHDRYNHLSITTILMPLALMSERLNGVGPPLNPPFWSLCYEIWFYIAFGLYSFTRGTTRILLLTLTFVLADIPVWMLIPAWLVGVMVGKQGTHIQMEHPRAIFALSILGFVLSQWSGLPHAVVEESKNFGINLFALQFSSYFVTDWIGAAFAGYSIIALHHMSGNPGQLHVMTARFSRYTYTLYLTHWPLLVLVQKLSSSIPANLRALYGLSLPIVGAVLLSPLLETWLSQLLRGEKAKPVLESDRDRHQQPTDRLQRQTLASS